MRNYGLVIPKIETREEGAEHYLGSSKLEGGVINPLGDWGKYLPVGELQNKGKFEPNACISFAINNAKETLYKFLTGKDNDSSDRALAIGSDTNPNRGSDPHSVAEYARTKLGFVPEEALPFDESIQTLEQFYSPKPLPQSIIDTGNKFFNEYEFRHKWVWTGNLTPNEKRILLQEALTKGTVCVSVSAWFKNEKGIYYKPEGTTDGHWVQLVSAHSLNNYLIFDSYAETDQTPYLKELDPLYDFQIAKIYYLFPAQPTLNWLQSILDWIASIIPFLTKQVKEIKPSVPPTTPSVPPEPPKTIDDTSPPVPAPDPPKNSKIELWAKAIQIEEGWFPGSRSYRNCNPGNLKASTLVQTLGSILAGFTGKDKDGFAIFSNYDSGFKALYQFLTFACRDNLKDYHANPNAKKPEDNPRTLIGFTKIYANPPNDNYAKNVASFLKVDVNIDIGEFLSYPQIA